MAVSDVGDFIFDFVQHLYSFYKKFFALCSKFFSLRLTIRSLTRGSDSILSHSGFSQMHKIGNIGIIANVVFPYICTFLLYFQHMNVNVKNVNVINVKFDVSGQKKIVFPG